MSITWTFNGREIFLFTLLFLFKFWTFYSVGLIMFGGLDEIKFFFCEILLPLVILLPLIILLSVVVLLFLVILLFLIVLIVLFGLLLLLLRNCYRQLFSIAIRISRWANILYFIITINISRRINTIRCMLYKFFNNLLPKNRNLHNFLLINNNLFFYFFNNLYRNRYFFIFNSFNKNRLDFTISFL